MKKLAYTDILELCGDFAMKEGSYETHFNERYRNAIKRFGLTLSNTINPRININYGVGGYAWVAPHASGGVRGKNGWRRETYVCYLTSDEYHATIGTIMKETNTFEPGEYWNRRFLELIDRHGLAVGKINKDPDNRYPNGFALPAPSPYPSGVTTWHSSNSIIYQDKLP